MSVTILLADSGETVTLNAEPKDVAAESGALIVRRDNQIIARFRRYTAWWETTPTQE